MAAPAHVTVVTRNPAIAMGLTHHGFDVTDVRPDRHGDWVRQAIGSAAVVLELSDAIAADAAVRRLRAEGNGAQVLVVVTEDPGWEAVVAHAGPGVRPLPLPVTLPSLASAVTELVTAGPIDVPPPPRNEEELLSAVAARVGLSITESGTLAGEPHPHVVEEVLGEPPPVEPESAPPVADDVPVAPRAVPAGTGALVAALTAVAGDLAGVGETAEVVCAELADRVTADATALLLPDGDEWHVASGVNLRPLEHRVRLAADHWLVAHVALGSEAVIVDDTDGAREQLHGAPLASWNDVLAVPVEGLRGVFVAARAAEAFSEDALRSACALAAEAAPLLREAMAVRVLARALVPFAELED